MTQQEQFGIDATRIRYALYVALAGFAMILIIAAGVLWKSTTDPAALIAGITGMVGTIVGAFLGVQAGSSGQERREVALQEAQRDAVRFAAALNPDVAAQIMRKEESRG